MKTLVSSLMLLVSVLSYGANLPVTEKRDASRHILVSASIHNSSGSWSVASETGDWVSSLTDVATGEVTINTSFFSDVPHCVVSGVTTSSRIVLLYSVTSSTVPVIVRNDSGTPTDAEADFNILCWGPR